MPCQGLAYHAEPPPPPSHPLASSPPLQPIPSPPAHRGAQWQLLFTGCLPHFHIFILAGLRGATGLRRPPLPPLVSLLRGGSGKTISGEHLDHLFRAPGVSRKPNCPHLCGGVFGSRLSLQVVSCGRCIRRGVRGLLHKLTLMPHEGLSVNSVKVQNV